jgi:hypothetical protein
LAPPLLILVDPGLFRRNWQFVEPEFLSWSPLLFLSAAIGVPALAIALGVMRRTPARWPRARAVLVGLLLGSAACAAAIGGLLLPYALFLIPVLIGLVGLVPLLTAWLLVRNARRLVPPHPARGWVVAGFLVAAGLPLASGLAVHQWKSDALEASLSGDEPVRARGLDRLGRLRAFVSWEDLQREWKRETDPARKERLAEAFRAVTGSRPEHLYLGHD